MIFLCCMTQIWAKKTKKLQSYPGGTQKIQPFLTNAAIFFFKLKKNSWQTGKWSTSTRSKNQEGRRDHLCYPASFPNRLPQNKNWILRFQTRHLCEDSELHRSDTMQGNKQDSQPMKDILKSTLIKTAETT